MSTKVQKWGNSLAVRLPREMTQRLKLGEGTPVVISPESQGLVIKPLRRQKLSLKELVMRITPENRHEAIDWGKPRGREVW